ncbi:MAG: spondin domain-containing protein [Longimicrobiales bacterium]
MKRTRILRGLLVLGTAAALGACEDDKGTNPKAEETTFEVRLENVSEVFDFTSTGVYAVPSGADEPGPLFPGHSYEFTFDAGPGSRVSFASMFGQSNDLFYAPGEDGIQVHDAGGMPLSGDITDQVFLWDAGTEVNQEPGLGPDQAPRQAGSDMGAADSDDTVRMAQDEFGNLPSVAEAIRVTLTHIGGTEFRIRIENVAAPDALQLSNGGTAPVVVSPGVWTVGAGTAQFFTVGEVDRGSGLERIAEDGDVTALSAATRDRTGLTSPIAPGVYAIHTGSSVLFAASQPDRGEGLEMLAEDADPGALRTAVAGKSGVTDTGIFNTPAGASGPGPAFPGDAFVFSFSAMPGDRLSLASMLGQSNDLFFAPAEAGIALFDGLDNPLNGDLTGMILLWDAGTEKNEFPGVGPNQAPRQPGPNTGPAENGTVRQVNDGYAYPRVDQVIRVTITPLTTGS